MTSNPRALMFVALGMLGVIVVAAVAWPKAPAAERPTAASPKAETPSFMEDKANAPTRDDGLDDIAIGPPTGDVGRYSITQAALDEALAAGSCDPFKRRAALPAAERGIDLPWFNDANVWCDSVRDGDGLRVVVLGMTDTYEGLPVITDGVMYLTPTSGKLRMNAHLTLGNAAEAAAAKKARELKPADFGTPEWLEMRNLYEADVVSYLKSDPEEIATAMGELRAMIGR